MVPSTGHLRGHDHREVIEVVFLQNWFSVRPRIAGQASRLELTDSGEMEVACIGDRSTFSRLS
jgi:hypothetical protein